MGQTLTVKQRPFRYYRCRHVYDKNTSRECSAWYVRGTNLEGVVWQEVTRVLTEPAVVLQELQRNQDGSAKAEEVHRLGQELAMQGEREQRLVRLFSLGDVDEALVQEELKLVRVQKAVLEDRVRAVSPSATPVPQGDAALLQRACAAIAGWLDEAGEEDRVLALEALQVAVATSEQAALSGVLPLDVPAFIGNEATSRCSCNGDKGRPRVSASESCVFGGDSPALSWP